jgi:hypothetical protein
MAECEPEHIDSGVASAQGTTASWGGDALGMLTSVQVNAGRAQLVDVTSVNATVVGEGLTSRVLREVGVASVEPARVSLTAYSTGIAVGLGDRGDVRMLTITGNGWFYSGDAILMDYNLTANVGGFVTISMDFQFTGG